MSDGTGRLRVLCLVKGLGPGGAERLLVEQALVGAHDEFDYEVAYLLDWKQHLVPDLESLGVATHCLGVHRELDPRWVLRLRELLRDGHYDVVHAHSPLPASVARLIRPTLAPPRPALVYTEHNRWQSHNSATRVANGMTFGLDDVTFAVSEDVRDSIDVRHRSRVEVLQHGIDLDAVRASAVHHDAVRAELGVDEGEVLAVTVANLRAQKNYPGLLAAARIVLDGNVPVQFVAAGQGQLEEEVQAEHGRLGLDDRFALLGYQPDATKLIAAADLYVLASHHEGLPVTVMEALALGVPVIAPAVGGLREVIDGRNGILVPPGDTRALADAIARVATDGVLRAELARGASESGERFSSRHAVQRIEAVYRALSLSAPEGRK